MRIIIKHRLIEIRTTLERRQNHTLFGFWVEEVKRVAITFRHCTVSVKVKNLGFIISAGEGTEDRGLEDENRSFFARFAST